MEQNFPSEITKLMQTLEDAGYQIYLVGGVVRDLLLGRDNFDWDLTTDATPDKIVELFPDGFYNNQFGTVGVPLSESVVAQVTTMRKESQYKDSRHPESVSWTNILDEDLARRDFTINAMALSLNKVVVDPFNGKDDLEKKIIRAVGDPNKRFQEDALRLLRAIRFASQLGFKIEDHTWQALVKNKDLIKNISWERIRDELLKIVVSPESDKAINYLKESGLLDIILPEISKNFGVVQEGEKHDRKYEIGEHLILTMKFTPSNDPIVKLAALLHDIGKAATYKSTNGNSTFYNHEIVGANQVKKIAERLKLSKKETEKLYTLVRYHMFTLSENQTDSAIRRFIRNVGVHNLEDMIALREGDRLGGGTQNATSWRLEQFKERIQKLLIKPFSITDLAINGQDVMQELSIPPSRKVGEILQKLFEEVEQDHTKNTKDYLIQRMRQIT